MSGQLVVSEWSVSGQRVVSEWSVNGQRVVSDWSVSGQLVTMQGDATPKTVMSPSINMTVMKVDDDSGTPSVAAHRTE